MNTILTLLLAVLLTVACGGSVDRDGSEPPPLFDGTVELLGANPCTAFAVGPRQLVTAAHCLSADDTAEMAHHGAPVTLTATRVDLWPHDRAWLELPPDAANLGTWFEVGSMPSVGETARVLAPSRGAQEGVVLRVIATGWYVAVAAADGDDGAPALNDRGEAIGLVVAARCPDGGAACAYLDGLE